jgi:hypothetical protein
VASFSSWEIDYFETAAGTVPIAEFVDALGPQAQAKFIRSLELLEQQGLLLREPWVKKYPGDSEIERAEIYIVWRNLPGVFLPRLRQKAHSAPRI